MEQGVEVARSVDGHTCSSSCKPHDVMHKLDGCGVGTIIDHSSSELGARRPKTDPRGRQREQILANYTIETRWAGLKPKIMGSKPRATSTKTDPRSRLQNASTPKGLLVSEILTF